MGNAYTTNSSEASTPNQEPPPYPNPNKSRSLGLLPPNRARPGGRAR